jgi:hypothetical protein
MYRYVPKAVKVFSSLILSPFVLGLQELEKN